MVILPGDCGFASKFPRKIENSWLRFLQQGNHTGHKLIHLAQLLTEIWIMEIGVATDYLFSSRTLPSWTSMVGLELSSCEA